MKLKIKIILLTVFWLALLQIYLVLSTWTKYQTDYLKSKSDNIKEETTVVSNLTLNTESVNVHEITEIIHDYNDITFFEPNRSKVQKIIINYEKFQLPEPYFVSEADRKLFHKNKGNGEMGRIQNETEKLTGEIYNVRDGTFKLPYDCGYRSDFRFVIKRRDVPKSNWYFAMAPMLIPEGNTFQHFIDGTLPKIVQIIDFLQRPYIKMLFRRPRDKIIYEMLAKLNINQNNIVYYTGGTVGADNLLFSCNTPPLHPVLWSKARRLLGAYETRKTTLNESKVILVTRAGSYNGGRNILNMEETTKVLYAKYGKDNVEVFNGPYSLNKSIELFGKAKILIGVHGGGLYNMLFCPKDTVVVEIMPTKSDGKMIAAADKIFWAQAYLLGHKYWRLSLPPENNKGNIRIDVVKFRNILDKIGIS